MIVKGRESNEFLCRPEKIVPTIVCSGVFCNIAKWKIYLVSSQEAIMSIKI
jgi:hypothetical protein